ncbi:DNA-binding transcriptional regulator LsrR, DeoR family [Arthrobacter subterraneus]|uniref:DNA-binding transcriptional regulator LsrR, DeoR family n=1 Tax=Arthrobacter subterraneus TaxID=335973 RepID=A0A1G8NFU1_9MICC|nr:sugar-binding domain-containing protein [Arthrobacter subterraneus]SDI79139.1 DNA-binding transcriptional regulator LsrR, DeoR family [Arthrobacter subterraneus]
MSKKLSIEDQVRHVYAALQHLQHNRSTVDIAEELGISRFTVGRMVQRAREEGLFEVLPRMHDPIDPGLSRALATRFGLSSALAVLAPVYDSEQTRAVVASVTAKLFMELIEEDHVVGLGPGRTIIEMCGQIREIPTCDVVQLTGVATTDAGESLRAVMTLSSIARGKMYALHAPMVATNAAAGRVIAAQPAVKQSLHRMGQLDMAVLTIGGWPDSSLLADQVSLLGELEGLMRAGVVAEVGTTLLRADGKELVEFEGRITGISTKQLRQIPQKIVIGGGPGKERAVVAVLKSGLADVLVTDVRTAQFALDHA